MTSILVAEDDPDIRDVLELVLPHGGHTVTSVPNGELALEAVHRHPPDLLILDVVMPGISGTEVCRRLRAGHQTRHLPIILLTAKAQEHDVSEGLACGADAYLVKPFSPTDLLANINSVLTAGRAEEGAPAGAPGARPAAGAGEVER